MSGPIVGGTVALFRQYFVDGFYVPACTAATPCAAGAPTSNTASLAASGVANLPSGFSPSASLLKAAIINSCSPTLNIAYDTLFNLPQLLRWQAQSQGGWGYPNIQAGAFLLPLSVTHAGVLLNPPTLPAARAQASLSRRSLLASMSPLALNQRSLVHLASYPRSLYSACPR